MALSFAVLALTALAQTAIFVASGSVALLADLIHNFGDAATAIPLAIADPVIAIAITAVILKITCDSWRTVAAARPTATEPQFVEPNLLRQCSEQK